MPTQEAKALERIQKMMTMIEVSGKIELEQLQAWGMVTMGVRYLTIGRYVRALQVMGIIDYDPKEKLITFVKRK